MLKAEKSHGGRAIHIAAEAAVPEALVALIEKCNVDLESKLLNDTTAMYLAAQHGLSSIVKILIDAGAQTSPVMPTVSRRDIMAYKKEQYGSPNIPNPDFEGFHYPVCCLNLLDFRINGKY